MLDPKAIQEILDHADPKVVRANEGLVDEICQAIDDMMTTLETQPREMVTIHDLSKFYGDLILPNCFLICAPPESPNTKGILTGLEEAGFSYKMRPWFDEDLQQLCTMVRVTDEAGAEWLRTMFDILGQETK